MFLDEEDLLFIHRREIEQAGGSLAIRDRDALDAAVAAPRIMYGGEYLMDLFNMAAAYLVAITFRHPFLDGNKRAGAAAALTFLYMNGYVVREHHAEELADLVFSLLRREIAREEVGSWFRERAVRKEMPDY